MLVGIHTHCIRNRIQSKNKPEETEVDGKGLILNILKCTLD